MNEEWQIHSLLIVLRKSQNYVFLFQSIKLEEYKMYRFSQILLIGLRLSVLTIKFK